MPAVLCVAALAAVAGAHPQLEGQLAGGIAKQKRL